MERRARRLGGENKTAPGEGPGAGKTSSESCLARLSKYLYFVNGELVSVLAVGGGTTESLLNLAAAFCAFIAGAGAAAIGARTCVGRMSTSTRRFCCLPDSLPLLAMGR